MIASRHLENNYAGELWFFLVSPCTIRQGEDYFQDLSLLLYIPFPVF